MIRSPLIILPLFLLGTATGMAASLTGDNVVIRGRLAGEAGARVKTVVERESATAVEITYGSQPFEPAAAHLDVIAPAGEPSAARFYFNDSMATAAARALVEVSRGAPTFETAPAEEASHCPIDPYGTDAMAEVLPASF